MNRTPFAELLDDIAAQADPVDLLGPVQQGVRRQRRRRAAGAALCAVVLAATAASVGLPSTEAEGPSTLRVASAPPSEATADIGHRAAVLLNGGGETTRVSVAQDDGTLREIATAPYRPGRADLASDGMHLAWASADGVVVLDLRDGTSRLLDVPVGSDLEPAWSPDASRIAITDPAQRDPASAVYDGFHLIDVATGEVTRVAAEHRFTALSWSPDGETIAMTLAEEEPSTGSETGIALVTPEGIRVRTLVGRGWSIGGTDVWSPDGTRLVVEAVPGPDARGRSLVVSADTGEELASLPANVTYTWTGQDALAARSTTDPDVLLAWTLGPPPAVAASTRLVGAQPLGGAFVALRPAA